jgi:hypothetical protein
VKPNWFETILVSNSVLPRAFTRHRPENRFDGSDFRAECERHGLEVARRFGDVCILVFDAFRGCAVEAGCTGTMSPLAAIVRGRHAPTFRHAAENVIPVVRCRITDASSAAPRTSW